MYKVKKDNVMQELASQVQVTAYLKSGWKLIEEKNKGGDTEALKAEANSLGVKYDANDDAEKIRQAIEKHKTTQGA